MICTKLEFLAEINCLCSECIRVQNLCRAKREICERACLLPPTHRSSTTGCRRHRLSLCNRASVHFRGVQLTHVDRMLIGNLRLQFRSCSKLHESKQALRRLCVTHCVGRRLAWDVLRCLFSTRHSLLIQKKAFSLCVGFMDSITWFSESKKESTLTLVVFWSARF